MERILELNQGLDGEIILQQYNVNSEKIRIKIEQNKYKYDLTGYTVSLNGIKPDSKYILIPVTIIDAKNGVIEFDIIEQLTIVGGLVTVQLMIMGSSSKIINSTLFSIHIRPSLKMGTPTVSTDDFTLLSSKLGDVAEWDKIFTETSGKIEEKYTERLNGVSTQLADIDGQNNNKKMKNVIGAIRNTGNGFNFISDSSHEPINGASVVTEGDRITINYGFNGSKVGTLLATPDETLSKLGYIVGTSVGLDNSKIYVSKQDMVFGYLTKSGGDSVAFTKTDNISNGIVDLMWESSSKRLKVTHDKCYSPIPNIFTRNPEIIAFPVSINPRGGFNNTYIGFRENKSLSSIIRYLGTTFTNSGDNGGVTSMNWDSVNSRLTVNHKSINNLCVNLTSRTIGLEIIPYTINDNNVVLEFYKNGQKITAPSTDINFILNKQSDTSVNIIPPDGTIACLSYNGRWEVPPSDITHLNSNIWLYGTIQI